VERMSGAVERPADSPSARCCYRFGCINNLVTGIVVTISVVEVARRSGSTASIPVKMLDRFADGSAPVNLYQLALPTGATLTDGDR
jgi:hypothetical protein